MAADTLTYLNVDSLRQVHGTFLTESASANAVCFPSEEGTVLAYRLAASRGWAVISLPFTDARVSLMEYNLDGQGTTEIVVQGTVREYGSQCGISQQQMMILDVSLRPTLILEITYDCTEECFGRSDAAGFTKSKGRRVKVGKDGIYIGRVKGRADCDLTPLAPGRYVYRNGRIRRR